MVEGLVGYDGIGVFIETPGDVYEAIDVIHTQVMDNLGRNHPLLAILDRMLAELEEWRET